MWTGLSQSMVSRLAPVMTPELKQSIQILQFSTAELLQYVEEQMLENPVVDVNDLDRWLNQMRGEEVYPVSGTTGDQHNFLETLSRRGCSLAEYLEEQLLFMELPKIYRQVCSYLVNDLNDNGYLDAQQERVCQKFAISNDEYTHCLQTIQSLEPAGIGAHDLKECLMLQLKRTGNWYEPVSTIVTQFLHQVGEEQYEDTAIELGISVSEVKQAVAEIRKCDPRPGAHFSTSACKYVFPDVWVVKDSNSVYRIQSQDWNVSIFRINDRYQRLLQNESVENKEAADYLRHLMKSAYYLIRGIEQRRITIKRIAELIVEHQQLFFEQGEVGLKPLTRRQIADQLDVHESTVSRATRHKYMQTPQGLHPLSFFFTSGLPMTHGLSISRYSAKDNLKQLVAQESRNKPLSDQKLAEEMQRMGIHISRRTVTKYRVEMGIPASNKRKSS